MTVKVKTIDIIRTKTEMTIINLLYLSKRSLQCNSTKHDLQIMISKILWARDIPILQCTCLANLLPSSKQEGTLVINKLLSTRLSTAATSIMTPSTPRMKAGRKWLMNCLRSPPISTVKCMWRLVKDLRLQSRILASNTILASTPYQCPKFQGLKFKSKEEVAKENWPLLLAQFSKNADFL